MKPSCLSFSLLYACLSLVPLRNNFMPVSAVFLATTRESSSFPPATGFMSMCHHSTSTCSAFFMKYTANGAFDRTFMKVEHAGNDTTAHSRSHQEHFLQSCCLDMWTCWARPACRKACKLMGRKEEQLAGHAASCPEFPKTSASNKPDYAPFIPMIEVPLAFA